MKNFVAVRPLVSALDFSFLWGIQFQDKIYFMVW